MARKRFPEYVPSTKVNYSPSASDRGELSECCLVVVSDPARRTYALEGKQLSIGAMEDNDIVLAADDTVSRYHCRIVPERDSWLVVDKESTNGTFVNGVRVREAFLQPDSVVTVGKTELRFEQRAAEAAAESAPSPRDRLGRIIGKTERMRKIFSIVERVAPTAATVVLEGETGTGKEVVARAVHALSDRSKKPFIVFDCGAVPDNLIESELFGHEKGSFTGAIMSRRGLFEMAQGGTIFLDELGELNLELQPKLLRVLEQREVRRVGSNKPIRVDVRIIAATNRSLEEEVHRGRFREDLFFRLSVVRILMPPLRERREDLPLLIQHFLANEGFNRALDGSRRICGVEDDAMEALIAHRWPGNVRELINVLERACSFAETPRIRLVDLPEHLRRPARPMARRTVRPMADLHSITLRLGDEAMASPKARKRGWDPDQEAAVRARLAAGNAAPPDGVDDEEEDPDEVRTFKDAKEGWISSFEREYIVRLLQRNNLNISHAAREADIDRKYFRKLMRKYGISTAELSRADRD